jgi:HK97 family phage major capsid protein
MDHWAIRLTKDSYSRYICGDPMNGAEMPRLFGLLLIPTVNLTSSTFLVGSGDSPAAEIRDRQGLMIEIATQHSEDLIKNKVSIRAEKRLALVFNHPNAFVTGTFTASHS